MKPLTDAFTEFMIDILNTCAVKDNFPDDVDQEMAAKIEKTFGKMSKCAAEVLEAIPPEMEETFLTAISLAALFAALSFELTHSTRNTGRRKSRGGRYPECEKLAKELYKINPKVTAQIVKFRAVRLGVEVPESDTTIRTMLKRIREENSAISD